MQTDIFLQKALVDEVKDILKGYTTLNNGEPVKFNVYPQNLPAKKGRNDEDHFPYVIEDVMKSDSEGLDENQEEDEFVVVEDDADDLDAEDDDEADQEDAACEEEEDL